MWVRVRVVWESNSWSFYFCSNLPTKRQIIRRHKISDSFRTAWSLRRVASSNGNESDRPFAGWSWPPRPWCFRSTRFVSSWSVGIFAWLEFLSTRVWLWICKTNWSRYHCNRDSHSQPSPKSRTILLLPQWRGIPLVYWMDSRTNIGTIFVDWPKERAGMRGQTILCSITETSFIGTRTIWFPTSTVREWWRCPRMPRWEKASTYAVPKILCATTNQNTRPRTPLRVAPRVSSTRLVLPESMSLRTI